METIPEFGLTTSLDDGHAVVGVAGELDISTAPELKRTLAQLIERGTGRITIDVSGVEFMDSNGIHALVTSYKLAQAQGGTIELRSPRPTTYKVLEIVGLTEVIPIV